MRVIDKIMQTFEEYVKHYRRTPPAVVCIKPSMMVELRQEAAEYINPPPEDIITVCGQKLKMWIREDLPVDVVIMTEEQAKRAEELDSIRKGEFDSLRLQDAKNSNNAS